MILRPLLIRAGDLKVPLRHQSPSNVRDAHGAPQSSWLERGIVWGAFEKSSAATQVRANAEEAERVAQILVRHRAANPCKPGDRLVANAVWYVNAVVDPDGTDRFQRVYCTTRDEEAAA